MPSRPSNGGSGPQRIFTRAEISERFQALVEQIPALKAEKHKHAARIAVLMNEINYKHKIMDIINAGFHDLWLPIPKGYEPLALEPGALQRFRQKQPLVLSDTFMVETSKRQPECHVNLASNTIHWPGIPLTLEFEADLGIGGLGHVAKVVSPSGRAYALKRIERKNNSKDSHEQMHYIKMELDVLKRIEHYHFVKPVASYTELKYVGILLDPAADCNLETYLQDFRANCSSERVLASFFGCLVTALDHLHNVSKIRHKDIKPKNILVHGNKILFTDFGTALDWSESGHTTTNEEKLRSPIYCAPEIAKDRPRNSMSDIWSLGCVFLEMAAVLKGRHWGIVRETLAAAGSQSDKYWDNPRGVREVIAILREIDSGWGNEPLEWVAMMLNKKKERRPTSRSLRNTILQARTQSGQSFCGYCCTTARVPGVDGDGDQTDSLGPAETSESAERNDNAVSAVPRMEPQYVQVHDPLLAYWSESEVKLMRDDRASKNWITAHIVTKFNLKIDEVEWTERFLFDGVVLESSRCANVDWMEADERSARSAIFVVVPAEMDVPFDMLVACRVPA
ncbi:serine/threonine protein kinase [Paramyrothecium foliicola]|nr:serine/threonine protein kinase [Paramyrothecium foliicola]